MPATISSAAHRPWRGNAIYLFVVVLSCTAYFLPRWASWNENARLDLVLAMVDDQTLQIDRYVANTGDYAHFDGHYYLDKAPGLSFLAAPVYAAARPLLRSAPVQQRLESMAHAAAFASTLTPGGEDLGTERVYFAVVLYLLTFVTVTLPSAALCVLIYLAAAFSGAGARQSLAATLLYALATPAFPYAGVFLAHQLVAFCLFAAFYLAQRLGAGQGPAARWLIGLLLGYALISEYPSGLIVVAILAYGLATWQRPLWVVHVAAAMLLPLALLATYNQAIFGTVLPVGYWYSERYTALHSQGFVSITGPQLEALWGISFSPYRGLFFLAPVTLLAVPGFVRWWRRAHHRAELAVSLWAVLAFLLFNGSSVMWHGGHAVGPRYVLPMLPFLTLAMAAGLHSVNSHKPWQRVVLVGLVTWSLLAVWLETIGGQRFPDWSRDPLFEYSLPHIVNGNVARNLGMLFGLHGLPSLVPLAAWVACLTLAWWRLRGRDV